MPSCGEMRWYLYSTVCTVDTVPQAHVVRNGVLYGSGCACFLEIPDPRSWLILVVYLLYSTLSTVGVSYGQG